MSPLAKKAAKYLAVGDPKWANRRRVAIGLIVFACIHITNACLLERDHEFATRVLDRMTDIILLALTIYGGGATAAQIIEKFIENRGHGRSGGKAQGGD